MLSVVQRDVGRLVQAIHVVRIRGKQAAPAPYGKQILATVSQELTAEFGAGFNYPSLTQMARFAEWMLNEQILATLSQTLSRSHFVARRGNREEEQP